MYTYSGRPCLVLPHGKHFSFRSFSVSIEDYSLVCVHATACRWRSKDNLGCHSFYFVCNRSLLFSAVNAWLAADFLVSVSYCLSRSTGLYRVPCSSVSSGDLNSSSHSCMESAFTNRAVSPAPFIFFIEKNPSILMEFNPLGFCCCCCSVKITPLHSSFIG